MYGRRRVERGSCSRAGLALTSLLLVLLAAGLLATACGGRISTTDNSPDAAATGAKSAEAATPPISGSPEAGPGGTRTGTIVYVKGGVDSDGLKRAEGIYTVRSDGTGLTRLVASSWAHDPVWSPDGRRIAYIEHEAVHVMRADGSGVRHVRPRADGADTLAWSPDGTRIAFVVGGWAHGLYVMRAADGRGRRLVHADFEADLLSPAWGPHGHIFFVEDRPRGARICSVHPDGTGFAALEQVPVFSLISLAPGGDWLLVWDAGRDRLLLAPASAAEADRRLLLDDVTSRTGMSQTDALSASMAQDGTIVFAADQHSREFPSALYVASAYGTRLRQIDEAGLGWDPVWRPE